MIFAKDIFVSTKFHFDGTTSFPGLVSLMSSFVPYLWKLYDYITFINMELDLGFGTVVTNIILPWIRNFGTI